MRSMSLCINLRLLLLVLLLLLYYFPPLPPLLLLLLLLQFILLLLPLPLLLLLLFYFSFPPIPVSSSAASFSSVHFSISSSLMTSTYSFLLHLLPPPSRIPLILHIIMRRFWGYLGLIDVWRRLIFNVILVLLSSLRWFFSDRPDLMKHFLRDCWGSVCFLGFGGFWFLSVVGVWFPGFVGIFVRIRS